MRNLRFGPIIPSIVLFCALVIIGSSTTFAQQTISKIFITGSDASAAPTVDLYIYALDSRGNMVDLTGQELLIEHDGTPVSDWEVTGTHLGGAMTVFVLDIPEGVASFIPVIQEAITRFAGDPYMMEGNDYVAIYRVDELGATQLLAPESFHNGVLNTFASPPSPTTGATALIDSVMNVLNNIDSIRPVVDMPVHMVLMTDGTDTVSTQFEPADLPQRAAELGVPVHTIWLDNENLSGDRERAGQQYLSQVAVGTHGESANLSSADQLTTLWDKISTYRNQSVVRYTLDQLTGGDHTIEVSVPGNPNVSASTSVSIAPGAPQITLDIPENSREVTLETVDQPIQLTFSTNVLWPDEIERTLSSAVLQVNGILAQEIDPTEIESFDATLSNLKFGDNRFQVVAIDDQGHRVATPEVVISILKGETTVIPEAVAPVSATDRMLDRFLKYGKYVGYCLGGIIAIILLIVIFKFLGRGLSSFYVPWWFRRIPVIGRYARYGDRVSDAAYTADRTRKQAGRYAPDVKGLDGKGGKSKGRPAAFLEVLQSTSKTPRRIDLDLNEIRLGRSSKQADVAFSGDSTVSRIHATVVQEGGVHRIFDEQSTSGTFVNEQRVPTNGLQLVDGDEIRLGAVKLRYRQP